ncbi:hypothetical protein COCNU_02G016480 [Cocos nucifera]|uniref:Uncharacterized protein n=1 Tax=Cocos nucifera TaxID=13894 RepID=A0A8K0I064_COCNU|nr:hypothetical protein COCNU_02G016480 [Cocos nucifera]
MVKLPRRLSPEVQNDIWKCRMIDLLTVLQGRKWERIVVGRRKIMGISVIMGLKATVSLLAFYFLKESGVKMIHIPLLHAALVDYLVAIASLPAVNLPLLLGKSSDGSFPLWSMLIFGPFLASARIFVFLRRLKSREPAYNKISEGLYVGAWPFSLDHLPPGHGRSVCVMCAILVALEAWKNGQNIGYHQKETGNWKHSSIIPGKKVLSVDIPEVVDFITNHVELSKSLCHAICCGR